MRIFDYEQMIDHVQDHCGIDIDQTDELSVLKLFCKCYRGEKYRLIGVSDQYNDLPYKYYVMFFDKYEFDEYKYVKKEWGYRYMDEIQEYGVEIDNGLLKVLNYMINEDYSSYTIEEVNSVISFILNNEEVLNYVY
jgi:hypothetical protein